MSCNIVDEYISFSQKAIKKYLQTILERYFDQDIYDDLINAYLNTRYYNMYPEAEKRFEINIPYYLKKALEDFKEDPKYRSKAKYMFQMFKYILYFDGVCECDSVRTLISEINDYRIHELNLQDDNFETKFYNLLKDDLVAKKEFIDSFEDKNFNVDYIKIKNQIFDCKLSHNLKFSKLYSDYAITKVFNNKEISEQKMFVTYSLVTTKILLDIIKGNFQKNYLVDYKVSLKAKPKKQKRLLNIIDNDIVKEKISLKINYQDFIENKEDVYELTRNGFQVAICLDQTFTLTDESRELLKIFAYIITQDPNLYDSIKSPKILYIPS